MVFAGVGRVISGLRYGFASGLIVAFTGVEVLGPPVVWFLGGSWGRGEGR